MEKDLSKSQMAKIRNFEKGFFATHLINIGAKLGLFDALNEAKEGITIPNLASKLGLHEPYLKIWCQTAYYFEILDCDDNGRFKLQPSLDEILGDKSNFKNYLGNITLAVDFLGKFFEEYPEYFKAGKIAEEPYTSELSKAVSQTTKNIYLAFFFMIFPKNEHLTKMLEHGIKFLDIGCGSGSLIIKLAQAFKNSTFVGVDPDPHGIEEAGDIISELKLGKQVSVKNIGGGDLPYNNEFDIASMVVTLHEILPGIRLKVVEKVYHALKSDGKLLILDFPYPDKLQEFRNPMHDFAILDQFFEVCGGFVHLNMVEQNEMLTKAGFKDIQRMPVGKGMFELITAVK